MVRTAIALCAAALCAGAAPVRTDTPTTQDVTVTMSDNTTLDCGLTLPGGSIPSGGWPGVLLFPGLGQTHAAMDARAVSNFAADGYRLASLACDERGTGASEGSFDLAGATDMQDVHDLFDWFSARPEVSDTAIGAFGISVGGAEVWNAAVAGVPFQAIVPDTTWTSLGRALKPNGVVKSGLLDAITALGPPPGWSSASGLASRSVRGKLQTLSVPTLIVQSRRNLLFDIDQARWPFNRLSGSRFLEIGTAHTFSDSAHWLFAHLAGVGPPPVSTVEVAGRTYTGLPRTRTASVNLPGTTTLTSDARVTRTAGLTGGPFTTLGNGSITVRYSHASNWDHLVATVSLRGSNTPLTEGAARITATSGVVTIPLMNEAATVPRGKPIVVTLGATSPDGLFDTPVSAEAKIRVTRVTCTLSFLNP